MTVPIWFQRYIYRNWPFLLFLSAWGQISGLPLLGVVISGLWIRSLWTSRVVPWVWRVYERFV